MYLNDIYQVHLGARLDILIISDTHMSLSSEICQKLDALSFKPDLIIHAGDITGDGLLNGLKNRTDVVAVRGNMDGDFATGRLPESVELDLLGWKIGVIHGRGAPAVVAAYARSSFGNPDLIIFGHTHVPCLELSGGTLLMNPGSLTSPRSDSGPTYARIALTKEAMDCQILTYSGGSTEEIARHRIRRPV